MSAPSLDVLLNDSVRLHEFIKNRDSDLSELASSNMGIVKLLQLSIIRNDVQYGLVSDKLEEALCKVGELDNKCKAVSSKLEAATDRISQLESVKDKQDEYINILHERLSYMLNSTAVGTQLS